MACRMQSSRWLKVSFAAVLLMPGLLMPGSAQRQDVSGSSAAGAASSQNVTDVLQQMSGRAGVIFIGQVLAVRPAASGVVEVDFRVDTAIRGCSAGVYTLREWAGLWAVGDRRYHVGQSLLMLLHTPSAAGLSSPIDGLNGAVPILQGGSATPYVGSAAPARIVDLRWLGAKLPRAVAYRRESLARANSWLPPVPFVATPPAFVALRAGAATSAAVIAAASGEVTEGSVPAQQASVDAVVGMLTIWEKARHAAP